jgi:hypothetical protein
MTASSIADVLNVSPGARVLFSPPPTIDGPFKTLTLNGAKDIKGTPALTGTGGIFGMNVNLSAFQGCLRWRIRQLFLRLT